MKAAETRVFDDAGRLVIASMNADGPMLVAERAKLEIQKLKDISRKVNAGWPDGNRFHAEMLEISPLLIMTMTFRTQARFAIFAAPAVMLIMRKHAFFARRR